MTEPAPAAAPVPTSPAVVAPAPPVHPAPAPAPASVIPATTATPTTVPTVTVPAGYRELSADEYAALAEQHQPRPAAPAPAAPPQIVPPAAAVDYTEAAQAEVVHLTAAAQDRLASAVGFTPGLPPAGWYPDPGMDGQLRYWTGVEWTGPHLPAGVPAPPVAAAPEPALPSYPDGAVAVPLAGQGGQRDVVHILAVEDWPSPGNSALQDGNFEDWAIDCLALDDYAEVWCVLRPTIGQITDMFAEYARLTGQDLGKSSNYRRALRRMGRK